MSLAFAILCFAIAAFLLWVRHRMIRFDKLSARLNKSTRIAEAKQHSAEYRAK